MWKSVLLFAVCLAVCCARDLRDKRYTCVDRNPNECTHNLRPALCYNDFNRHLCCASCEQFHSGSIRCPYGDRNTVITRDENKYTCGQYIAWFGTTRCSDPSFAVHCCASCGIN